MYLIHTVKNLFQCHSAGGTTMKQWSTARQHITSSGLRWHWPWYFWHKGTL